MVKNDSRIGCDGKLKPQAEFRAMLKKVAPPPEGTRERILRTAIAEFSEKGYDVVLIAKLSEPKVSLVDGRVSLSTGFVAEGSVAHEVSVLGFARRVSMPVAGDGRIELEERARP